MEPIEKILSTATMKGEEIFPPLEVLLGIV
jgi:hypothetical protein